MLDMGFAKDIERILGYCDMDAAQAMLFSATTPPWIKEEEAAPVVDEQAIALQPLVSRKTVANLQKRTHGRNGVFGSTTRRFHTLRQDPVPGAGAYNPNASAVEPSIANAAAGMRGHGKRFTEQKSETDADIGPGAYDSHIDGSVSTKATADRKSVV